jgi:hypothetical protein
VHECCHVQEKSIEEYRALLERSEIRETELRRLVAMLEGEVMQLKVILQCNV